MVDTNYIAVYDKDEVNFYDAKTTKMVILGKRQCSQVGETQRTACGRYY